MGCSTCKKRKKMELDKEDLRRLRGTNKSFFNGDNTMTWIIVIWTLFGIYGLWRVFKDLISLL